jgi:hypothetical protein
MPISWQAALRLYAKQKGSFMMPKKGSSEYDEVRKLMEATEHSSEHETKPRGRKSKDATASGKALDVGIVPGKVSKKRAPTGQGGASEAVTRHDDPVLPPAAKTTPIDAQVKPKRAKAVVNPTAHEEKGKAKGIDATGKTVKANAQEFIQNSNLGMSAAVSAQLADQKEVLEKELKRNKKTPKVVTVGEGQEETIDNMKTDDPAGISGKAPFSIQALRNKLLC